MSNTSPIGVISFPSLFQAKLPAPNAQPGSERFSVNLVWNKDAQADETFKLLKKNIFAAAKEKWGDKAEAMFKNGSLRNPLREAGEKEYAGYEDGFIFANFWSKSRPGVVDGKLEDVIDPSYVYPGALGRCSYRAFAYDASGNRGVALGLMNIQVTDVTTPRLDGRSSPQNDFDAVSGQTDDMSKELADDEMPF